MIHKIIDRLVSEVKELVDVNSSNINNLGKIVDVKCYCDVCGWAGRLSEAVELADYYEPYGFHESCPRCWEQDAIDNEVTWGEIDKVLEE